MPEKRENGVYRANFRYKDPVTGEERRCRQSLGTKDRREAVRREVELQRELETPPPPPEPELKRAAFSGFARFWLDTHVRVNCKPSYYRSTESALRIHLVPFFGDRDLREIGPVDVDAFKASRVTGAGPYHSKHADGREADALKLGPKTINNLLGVLGRMFSDAQRWGYCEHDPTADVQDMPLPPPKETWWSREQSDAFLEACQRVRPEWYPFFLAALRTGMRLGELFGLDWSAVDFSTGRIQVRQAWVKVKTPGSGEVARYAMVTPKSGKARTISMSPKLAEVLRAHRTPQEIVFPFHDGTRLERNRIKSPFWTVCRAAGIPKIRLHDLRHSFASQLVADGTPLKAVQELLGHADIKMTMRYAHLAPAAADSWIARLDGPAQDVAPKWPHSAKMAAGSGANQGRKGQMKMEAAGVEPALLHVVEGGDDA